MGFMSVESHPLVRSSFTRKTRRLNIIDYILIGKGEELSYRAEYQDID